MQVTYDSVAQQLKSAPEKYLYDISQYINYLIDLFVKMPPVFYNAIAAAQFLEELLGCKVDLICDHENLNQFFRNQIEKYGIDIFRAA